jgi:hypothetical protein
MVLTIRTIVATVVIYGIILCFDYELYAVLVSFIFGALYLQLREISDTLKTIAEGDEYLFLEDDACDGDCLNCMCDESK